MFFLDWMYAVAAMLFQVVLVTYISSRKSLQNEWGDVSQSLIFHQACKRPPQRFLLIRAPSSTRLCSFAFRCF